MKNLEGKKMGSFGRTLVLGTVLLTVASPMTSLAKTNRVNTPGTWRKQGEKWQFLREYGTPEKGWLVYEKDWYYQSPVEEHMETGWLNLQGKTYFLSTENDSTLGHVLTGWQWIDGYCYYFEEADQADYGVLFTGGRTKDGYYVDANGRWLNEAGGEPVYISGKGLSASLSEQQVAGVSRSIPSGNVGQVAGVSRSGGRSSGGSTSGSTSTENSENTAANAGNNTGTTTDNIGNTGNTANNSANTGNTAGNAGNTENNGKSETPASSSNLSKEEEGKSEEKPGSGENGNSEEKPGTGESGKPEEKPSPETPEEKNVIKLVGEAKLNQDVKLYLSKDIMDDKVENVFVDFWPVLSESHRENEPSYSLDREKQILTLPKSLFKKSKTYDITIQTGGEQPFHVITIEVKD
ncbi:hypothetical protein [Oribacterium asaccharolyticum]|uniref:hypothetical protein n=1 Tax=Oribacterium asaccharolyticum TaxID=1501332 RepID=UPI0028E9F8BA|nr:hypothetical protein [Oribacterium asaccharolyticum]